MSRKKSKPHKGVADDGLPAPAALFWSLPTAFSLWYLFILAVLFSLTATHLWQGLALPFYETTARVVPLLHQLAGYLTDLLFLSALVLSAHGLGAPIARALLPVRLSGLERILHAQAFGWGLLALLTLALGITWGVTPGLAFVLLGIGLGITAIELARWMKQPASGSPEHPGFFSSMTPLEALLSILIGYALFYHLVGALAPETFYDSLVYHLGAPNVYRLRGRIVPIEGILHAHFPQNMEMLYLLGLLLRNAIVAKLIHFWMLVLTLGAIYSIGRTACSRLTGLAAGALFCTIPVTAFAAWHTSVELGAAFWTLMGLWALLRGFHTHSPAKSTDAPPAALARWTLVSGLFHGLALGVKYTAAWNAGAALFILLLWVYRNKQLPQKARWRLLVLWALAVSVAYAPWALKNIAFTGNPVYPFLGRLFGPPLVDVDALKESARGHFWHGGLLHWKTWLRMPWDLFTQGRSHYSFIGPLWVIFFPLFFRVRKAVFPFGWILIAFILEYLIWSASTSMVRFIIPSLPLFCLYTAHQLNILGRQWRTWTPWLVLPVLLWNLAWNGVMLIQKEVTKVVFGRETVAAHLRRPHIGYAHQQYEMSLFIDEHLAPHARILVIGEVRTAFLNRDSSANSIFNPSLLLEELKRADSARALYNSLAHRGFTHVLADFPETLRNMQPKLRQVEFEKLKILSRFWRGALKSLHRNDQDVALYRLQEPARKIRAAASPQEIPEIVRIALDGKPAFETLPPQERARLLMSLAD